MSSTQSDELTDGDLADLGSAELTTEIMSAADLEDDTPQEPAMTSPDWPAFVMNQFDEGELDPNGHPKVAGLRRVARLLLGPILESSALPFQAPTLLPQYGMMQPAVVQYRVRLLMCRDLGVLPAYEVTFTDVADVYAGNTDPDYARHASAMAATRAEARCLRKALQLNNVASEETTVVPTTFQGSHDGLINPEQVNFINVLCARNNINVLKFINMGKTKYDRVDDIPYDTAARMVEHLSGLQNDPKKVSAEIKGYDRNWRSK